MAGFDTEFNLQTFLEGMRGEQRDAHTRLTGQMQTGFNAIEARARVLADNLHDHELSDTEQQGETNTRLKSLEDTNKAARWFAASLVVGTIGFIFDMLVNHWKIFGGH